MANTYKDIVITPFRGDANNDPIIKFSAGDASTNSDMNVRFYATSNGTLSFEGTAGQLFSITNDLSGILFSVNDISGIPSIEVDANGKITMATFGGNVGIGTSNAVYKLDVAGLANFNSAILVAGTNVVPTIAASFAQANTGRDHANAAHLTANASFTRANTAKETAELAFGHANLAFAKANTANLTADLAFGKANVANQTAEAAFAQANIARLHANTAHLTANAAFNKANTANLTADLAFGHANLAFAKANTANITADLAYAKANTANITADLAFGQANTARDHANSAHLTANAAFDKANTANITADYGYVQANTARDHANAAFASSNTKLANTSNVTFAGNLNVSGVLTANSLTSSNGFIDLGPGSRPPYAEGRIYYDHIDKSLTVYNEYSDFALPIGQIEYARVFNDSGAQIEKGKAVYATSYHTETHHHFTIGLADASDANKYDVVGLAAANIANNSHGYVITRGWIGGINTASLTAGSRFHLGYASPGSLVTVSPEYPNYPYDIGYCVTSNNTNGYLYVDRQTHTIEGLRVLSSARVGGDLTVEGALTVFGTENSVTVNSLEVGTQFIYLNAGDSIPNTAINFTGSGLNDLEFKGHYTGNGNTTFYVVISDVSPDKFSWGYTSNFSVLQQSNVTIQYQTSQLLSNGISVYFNANTGHTIGDKWNATAFGVSTDFGFIGNHINGPNGYTHAGMFRDATDGTFKFFNSYDAEPNGNIDIANTTFNLGNVQVNRITAAEVYEGSVKLSTSIASSYDVANQSFAKANTANITADAAIAQANIARLHANTAHLTANAAYDQANIARTHANTAHLTANAAFNKANTANLTADLAYTHANNAYAKANTANLTADLAFGQANTGRSHANSAYNIANLAFDKANTGASGAYYQGNNGDVGAVSGLGDIFRVHTNTLNANVTIYSGNNALAAGPITIATGKTLTIQVNARVAIV